MTQWLPNDIWWLILAFFNLHFSVFFHIILKVQSQVTFAFQFLPKKTNNFFLQLASSQRCWRISYLSQGERWDKPWTRLSEGIHTYCQIRTSFQYNITADLNGEPSSYQCQSQHHHNVVKLWRNLWMPEKPARTYGHMHKYLILTDTHKPLTNPPTLFPLTEPDWVQILNPKLWKKQL